MKRKKKEVMEKWLLVLLALARREREGEKATGRWWEEKEEKRREDEEEEADNALRYNWLFATVQTLQLSREPHEVELGGVAAEFGFDVDVAPRSHSSIRLLPLHREEVGRGGVFAVLDVAPALDSLSRINAYCRILRVEFGESLTSGLGRFSDVSAGCSAAEGSSVLPGISEREPSSSAAAVADQDRGKSVAS
uniref:Uncharacterized protein n=1 Tax=Ananas comosus var. bracteatus TaxID=296719 RepID=A0A6V7PW52_ANACO|nr:unnamed protein product [Ananas comosus var. bracteatus]